MVTEQQISEARAAVEQAESALDVAEVHHEGAGSEQAVTELRAARAAAYAARDRYRFLQGQFAREQAAGRAREAAEAGFPEKERKAVTQRLEAARDEAVSALVEAERAAARLLAATAAYGAVVRETAAGLKARGLSAGEGGEDGGTTGGVVHLGGETWRPADAPSLLAAVARSAVAARDPRHPVARWRQVAGLADRAAQDELLAKAAER
ncbi:hypothetical protein [Streptomyces sp. HUAS TT20]|uniref:hypothetical protein n=1 Tax=Streptomyces sp. HUAS TT20 TaxID=3447509 RepID=UPI0021DA09CB|nr:hypothetical protein [Streptomyces sp. HUAS 15-9]UXY28571.1 hypothetical protein N8I87_19735 [Streptomyces sp. HUAS 15-9]